MSETVCKQIEAAEERRTTALLGADVEALEELLADEFIYVHSNASTEDKATYLAALGSGKFKWKEFGHAETVVQPYGSTALTHGLLTGSVELGEKTYNNVFRYAALWIQNEDSWKLALWQNTKPQS